MGALVVLAGGQVIADVDFSMDISVSEMGCI